MEELIKKIKIKAVTDERGTLCVLELKDYVDWEAKRIYFLTDVKADRGGHAVRNEKKFYVCQKGTVKAKFHDGKKWINFELSGPNEAILADQTCFREFYDFSSDCVLLAVSNINYDLKDYIYNLEDFIKEFGNK